MTSSQTNYEVPVHYTGTAGFLDADTPFAATAFQDLMQAGLSGPGTVLIDGLNPDASYNLILYSGGDSAGNTIFTVNGLSSRVRTIRSRLRSASAFRALIQRSSSIITYVLR